MHDALNALKARFPLLSSLRIHNGADSTEGLAAIMGVLLAAITQPRYSSFCFVFPRKARVAPLTAVLYALGRFSVDFPQLTEQYAQRSFEKGQRVRLVPEGKIFVFGGLWPGLETRFRLELLNEKAAFTWPVSEILRIEPTHRKMPKGHFIDGDRARQEAPLSLLDKLIGTKTFGNTSLAVNHVLYLGGQSEFEEFLTRTSFVSSSSEVPSTADHLVSAGFIDESGAIRHRDNYQAAGEPFIAVSSRIENVAAACASVPLRSKVVIVDGARRINELAKFDTIAETQNMIIVAEAEEEDKLRQLYDRGCRFWRFSLAELEVQEQEYQDSRFFEGVFRSARNEAEFRTEVLACQNPHLEQASVALEKCQNSLEESEGDETQRILQELYGLLMSCTGLLEAPGPEDRDRLRTKADKLSAAAEDRIMWLTDVSAKALREACAAIRNAIEDPEMGAAKGRALAELLANSQRQAPTKVGLVARSASNRLRVSAWLDKAGFTCPVLLSPNAGDGGFFDLLVCTAWPNALNFTRLVRQYAAPLICLVAYPFEIRWLHRFNQRQRDVQLVPGLKSPEKSDLLGLSDHTLWPAEPASPVLSSMPPVIEVSPDNDFEERITRKGLVPAIEPGEDAVPTKLVSFSGDSYAFLTETLRVPVITDLVSGTAGENYKVPRRRLEQIRVGDVLVFRDCGRKDVIQALADAQLGTEAPAIRERAGRWHRALRESGLDESTLMNELEEVNCPRTIQTVHSWLTDDSMIGPQTKSDLEAMAYAAGNQKLLQDVPNIWQAIQILRGEHLSAGMRLSRILLEKLPERLGQLQEGRTRIEIDNATSAWIVQVEEIAENAQLRPRSHINTIMWYEEGLA